MTEPVIALTVPYDLGRLAPNLRLHPQERKRRERTAAAAARLAYFQAGAPQMDGKVRVTLILRRGRVIDPDGAFAAARSIINALFCRSRQENAGMAITPDDSARFLEFGPLAQETGQRWKRREEVLVLVEALP